MNDMNNNDNINMDYDLDEQQTAMPVRVSETDLAETETDINANYTLEHEKPEEPIKEVIRETIKETIKETVVEAAAEATGEAFEETIQPIDETVVLNEVHTDGPQKEQEKYIPYEYNFELADISSLGGGNQNKKAFRSKRRNNFAMALAAFAVVVSIGAGSFGLGLGAGFGIKNAEFAKNAVEVSAQVETSAPSASSVIMSSDITQSTGMSQEPLTVSNIYKSVSPSVVSINVKSTARTMFNQTYETQGAGSGIIFKQDDEKVYIVTNYHVVTGATAVTISLDDNVQVSANPVGGNESDDIAVISVNKADMIAANVTDYSIATFADSSLIQIGDTAIAIGNALGEGKSATLGIISAIDKQIDIENQIHSVIQTDAAINPGNSGGALVNAKGQVIGINTAKLSSFGVEGMGYAIPSNKVSSIIDSIIGEGRLENPQLGVEVVTITEQIKVSYNFPSLGVYINNVESNSSADIAGIRQGDIITAINGKTIETSEELSSIIQSSKVGDKLTVSIIRNGRTATSVDVTLKSRGLNF